VSMQGGAQEPEPPDQPDEQLPGEPGTMPDDDPSQAPEPPDPDRDPSRPLTSRAALSSASMFDLGPPAGLT